MRGLDRQAKGVRFAFTYTDATYWPQGRQAGSSVYVPKEILVQASRLMNRQPRWVKVRTIVVNYGRSGVRPGTGRKGPAPPF